LGDFLILNFLNKDVHSGNSRGRLIAPGSLMHSPSSYFIQHAKVEMKFQNEPNLIKRGSISLNNSFENNQNDFEFIGAGLSMIVIITFGRLVFIPTFVKNARFHPAFRLQGYIHFFIQPIARMFTHPFL